MRREAWGTGAAAVGTAQPTTPAGPQGRRAPPQTVQVSGPKSRTHDALRALAEGPTRSIFVYDLDSNIPASDLEHGLHGLFSVFGPVLRVSSLPGWKDTAQAMVAYGSADHARQAMGRLQNFPIWGRPLRLAYAQEDDSPARGEDRKAPERPATAPQQRPAPSGLPSTAGDSSEAAGVRRRIWDVSEVRTEQEDARDGGHTQTPVSSHGRDSANRTESAMERFDRMVLERLVNNSHAMSPVARPARPHGPSPGARNMRTPPPQADRGLLDADARFLDSNVDGAPNGSAAWHDRIPESLHAAHIPSESTIEEHSDTVTDGEEDVGGGVLISGLGTSALSDVEAGSELPAATDSAASSAHPASDSDASDSSDLSSDDGGQEARGGGKGGSAVAWRDMPPAVGDMEEGEDYGDEEDVDMAALASLLGAGGGDKPHDPGNSTQLHHVLTVAQCMRQLDQLMDSLNSLQEAEAHLRADRANALQPGLEDDGEDDEGQEAENSAMTQEEQEEHEEAAASLANMEAEDALADVVSRFSNIQRKLAKIPPNFLQALGMPAAPAPLLSAAPRALGPAGEEEETDEDCSSVEDEGSCAAEGVDAYEDAYENSRRPARGCNAQELGLDEAFTVSTQESELETEVTAETEETGQESDDLEQTEAEVDLQLRLEAENLEDAMLTSELERELQELSHLQGQIAYLKEMLRKTKAAQQRLLHSAEADEEISVQDSSAVPTEDEDHDDNAAAHAGREVRRNGSPLRSNMRHPSVPHRRAAEGGEDADEDSVAGPESMDHVARPHSRLSEGRPHSRLSEGRPASRLSWADDEVGRRFLPNDDSADFPSARPSSRPAPRLSRLSERRPSDSNASDSLCPTPDVDELDAVLLQSRAHLRDIRLAVLFSRTLCERADRLHFLADFIDHFQAPRGAWQAGDSSAMGGSSAARFAASGGSFASQMAAGSAGAGRGLQGNTWTAADLENGFGEEGDCEEEGDGEDADDDADAQAASVSRASSFSGLGSTAWSKFSTLPHPSPRSGSLSVGLASLGSGGFARDDEDGAAGDSDDAIASDSHASAGAAWEGGGDVTELQVLHEIRSLPAEARREALLVIRRMSQGMPGSGYARHAADAGHALNASASASRSSTSPGHAARAVGGSSQARRTCLTKLTDSEPEDEAVLDEVPPVGAGEEETEDGEATASSWRSIEDDVSNDSTLARLAQPADAARAAAGAGAQSDASPCGSSSSVAGYGSPSQRKRSGQVMQHSGRGNLPFTASPAAQRTPHRRNNYFVDNLELESPNKVPDDSRPCFDDDSEGHESLAGNCEDLVKDVNAQRAGAPGSNRQARSRRAGARGSNGSSAGSVAGSASSALSPVRSDKIIPNARAGALLHGYDYAESVSSVTESMPSSAMCGESDWEAEPINEKDERASVVGGQSARASHPSGASRGAQATGDAWDRDVATAIRRKIQTVIRERERVGFLNVSFTSTDLGGLAKLVERVLRNQGCKVDEQLRGMLHNALYKYRHAVVQHESEQLVQDVTEILQKERVFLEVVARVRRGYEQEMRDYHQYPPAVRNKLVEQLRVRRDRDMMQLDKERRARGHSNVQHVHSDSNDDSGSLSSMQSDDFDAVLDAAVPVAPGADAAGGRPGKGRERERSEQVSSSAECATDDVESSSFGSAVSIPSAASETVHGSSHSSAALLTPLKRSTNASPAKAATAHTPNRGAAVAAGRQQSASADATRRVVNSGAAPHSSPVTASTVRNGNAHGSGGSSSSGSEAGWLMGGKPASQPTSQAAKGKAKTDARHAASGRDGDGGAAGPLAPRFQDGEFEEITIDDLSQSAAPAARRGWGEDDAVSRAQHALGRHRQTETGKAGAAGVPRQAGGGAKKGGVMSFGPGGIKMPPNLAAALA